MTMARIGKFTLNNGGAFVARGSATIIDEYGEKARSKSGQDILVWQTRDVKPGDLGVPDGAIINLYVVVVASINNDNEAPQSFIFDKSSAAAANYKITGTTGDNTLALLSVG